MTTMNCSQKCFINVIRSSRPICGAPNSEASEVSLLDLKVIASIVYSVYELYYGTNAADINEVMTIL